MRLFIYEWITGGGLAEHHGPLPESLLREGLAMAMALAADANRIAEVQPVLMRDLRIQSLVAPGAEIQVVDSRADHNAKFNQLAAESDLTLLIAPETDGTLLQLVKQAESLNANLCSPGSELVELASDKEQTSNYLRRLGVPVPLGQRLEPNHPLPEVFDYPAVVKPIDGAGSQDTHMVASSADRPPAYAWPRWLEPYVPGTPLSVALLCDPQGEPTVLVPCRQRLTSDGRFAYLGGTLPLAAGLAKRATKLALHAIQALPTARGYVGVDMVLGASPDGDEDYVIEINPRLTTSYVGLRAATQDNLLQSMIDVAQSRPVQLEL